MHHKSVHFTVCGASAFVSITVPQTCTNYQYKLKRIFCENLALEKRSINEPSAVIYGLYRIKGSFSARIPNSPKYYKTRHFTTNRIISVVFLRFPDILNITIHLHQFIYRCTLGFLHRSYGQRHAIRNLFPSFFLKVI